MEKKDEVWQVVSSKYLFRRPWLTVRCDDMLLPNGNHIPDEYKLSFFGDGDGVHPVGILKDVILRNMIAVGQKHVVTTYG